MADSNIDGLTAGTPIATDIMEFEYDPSGVGQENKKVTFQNLSNAVASVANASAAQINTGTATNVVITPDSLAASSYGIEYVGLLINKAVALVAGNDSARFRVPLGLNGRNLVSVAACRKSGTGTLSVQIRNVTDAVDMLSTNVTVDTAETDSSTAATPAVINTATDDVATADQLAIDVDDAGTDTYFAYVELGFQLP